MKVLMLLALQTNGPSWSVPTGRRDGLVSSSSDAANLPTPSDSVTVLKQKFSDKGLTTEDLVILAGESSACSFHYIAAAIDVAGIINLCGFYIFTFRGSYNRKDRLPVFQLPPLQLHIDRGRGSDNQYGIPE